MVEITEHERVERYEDLARALVQFSRQAGCLCIAEGVETPGELDALRRLGLDAAQGYLLSRPVPIADIEAMVRTKAPIAVPAPARAGKGLR